MSTSNMSDSDIIKCSSMVKRAQGKSTFGLINLRKRVFVLTRLKLCYYDGTLDVSTTAARTHAHTTHATYTHMCTVRARTYTHTLSLLLLCTNWLEYGEPFNSCLSPETWKPQRRNCFVDSTSSGANSRPCF